MENIVVIFQFYLISNFYFVWTDFLFLVNKAELIPKTTNE